MVADSLARTVTRLVANGAADADLLRRFVGARDEAAFTLLVRRHGPMVFGVCRRTLGHQQDAEDAFQAVFLVLARKADTVQPDRLGRWLYGVAVRVANKARARRARHAPAAELPEVAAAPAPPPADWQPLLDAALARLPDRDRDPILLCDLLGRSRAEAAAELGINEGTLSSRLARARDRLRARLARLGAALSLPALAAGLADESAATVPATLLETTVAAGTSAAAARELADGVLRTMFLAKLFKLSALGLCVLGLAAGGLAWLPTAGADPATQGKEVPKGGPPAKDAATADSDLERIQGTWIIESVKWGIAPEAPGGFGPGGFGGFGATGYNWNGIPMTFDGDRVEFDGLPGTTKTFNLDPTRDPKRIDFHFNGGPRRGGGRGLGTIPPADLTRPSIYKFDGDKLHLVLGDAELQERPESFEEPGKDSPFVYVVLHRPTADQRARLERDERETLQGTWDAAVVTTRGERRAAPDGMKLVVKGDRLRFDAPAGPLHATYTLNLGAHPWQIDLTATADWGTVKKGERIAGIVSRQGLRVTLALGAPARPTSFEAAAKDGTVYLFVREGTSLPPDMRAPRIPAKDAEPAPKPANTRLRQLQEERVKVLEDLLQGEFERVKIGKDPLAALLDPIRERAELKVELADTKEAKVAAQEQAVRQLVVIEEQLTDLQKAGLQTKEGLAHAKAARLKAEIELEKLKAAR